MSQETPRRLLDDPSVDARLRHDLANTRALSADYDVQAGLETLSAALLGIEAGGLVEAGTGSSAEAASLGSSADWAASLRAIGAKWWGLSAAGLASVGAIWWVQLESPAHSAHARAAPSSSSAQVETAASARAAGGAPARSVERSAGVVHTAVAEHRARAEQAASDATASTEGAKLARARSAARPTRSSPAPTRTESLRSGPDHQAQSRDPRRAQTGAAPASKPSVQATSVSRTSSTPSAGPSEAQAQNASETSPASSSKPRASQGAAAAEVEHLARVRKLLAADPAQALQAAREGQERFVGGLFAEERAALIVFALARLNRTHDTLREARSFLRAYPSGPFVARVRSIETQLEGRGP